MSLPSRITSYNVCYTKLLRTNVNKLAARAMACITQPRQDQCKLGEVVSMKNRLVVLAALLIVGGAIGFAWFSGTTKGGSAWEQLLADSKDPGDWVTYGGTFEEQRFSKLRITSYNVCYTKLLRS